MQLTHQTVRRWIISFVLGGLLLCALLWEAQQSHSMRAISQSTLEAEEVLFEIASRHRAPLTLRNPDRWEGHEATQQLRLLRQCINAGDGRDACLGKMVHSWRQSSSVFGSFLEALRYHERQPGHEGDPGQIVDQVLRMMPEAREQIEAYQLWFNLQRHRGEAFHQRFSRVIHKLQPRYLGLMLQAEQAANQGLRSSSLALYEAAAASFLDAMLEKMRNNESIAVEAYNQSQDQKDLARLYLRLSWWAEAEKVLYRLAEQEPSDHIVLGLMEQLRLRSSQSRAG